MQFSKFLTSVKPSFKKDTMRTDLANLRKELMDDTIPPYLTALKVLAKHKWSDGEVKSYSDFFDTRVKTEFRGNFVFVVSKVLQRTLDNLPTLERLIELHYSDDAIAMGMTYLHVNLLQYLETISFVTKYARHLLLWATYQETAAVDKEAEAYGQPLAAPDVARLFKERETFFQGLQILSGKKAEMEKQFSEVPDVTITQTNVDRVAAVVGAHKTDPFGFGIIPIWMNPIYHIGMAIAEWQVARYQAAKEEARALELRLQNLKDLDEGKPDAGVQKQIAYREGQLQKLNFKIKEMEADHG